VRQAIAYGIDRNRVSQIGEYGYEPPAPQNYVLLPDFASWYDRSLAAKYNYTYNPTKAKALLARAGFKNKRISLSIINVGGNTDWVASLGVVKDDLKQIGIDLSIQNLSSNDYNARTYNGRFELSYQNGSSAAPNPYYDLRFVLFSGGTAPIGQAAAANYERWRDPTSDRLLNQFSATTNTALQHQIINKLQGIMLENVPVIPVTEGVSWFQYDTTKFTGWPTRQNPYVDPAPYDVPDWEIVLQNVHLK
jgi:peptide/nickel transport system substrate-binding protein